MRTFRFTSVGLSLVAAAAAALPACGSDGSSGSPSNDTSTGGAPAGTGGAPIATGGAALASGGATTGGGGAAPGAGGSTTPPGKLTAADAKITGTVTQCTGTTPASLPPDISVDVCTIPGCQAAACLTNTLIAEFVNPPPDTSLLAACGADPAVKCVPVDFIATTGSFLSKTCTSLDGAEGRCISTCVPAVSKDIAFIPQDTCGPNERCAPCFEPRDGTDTKACRQGCDPGPDPAKPPVVFAKCGDGAGQCVPQALVPEDLKAVVPKADCTQTDHVCAPIAKVKDLKYNFPKCVPNQDATLFSTAPMAPENQRGGCVPHYLVDNYVPAPPAGILAQDTCQTGELCAPCFNPLTNPQWASTGACASE